MSVAGRNAQSALQFVAYVSRAKDDQWNIRFPDIEGCFTRASDATEIYSEAQATLEQWLRRELEEGGRTAWPSMHLSPRADEERLHLTVPPGLAIAAQIRRMRTNAGWSQTELARQLGVSQQQVAKLEDPDANPTVDTVMKVANVFQQRLLVAFGPAAMEPRQGGER
jgi:DNA-binding XRE family transcriptional regulator/predicted RNase H-like HicB family nuclease